MNSLNEDKEKLKNTVKALTIYKENQLDYEIIKTELKLKKKELGKLEKARKEDNQNISIMVSDLMNEKSKNKLLEMRTISLEADVENLKHHISELEIQLEEKNVIRFFIILGRSG